MSPSQRPPLPLDIECLASHRIFGQLTTADQQWLAAQATLLTPADGELVAAAHELPAHLWWILSGKITMRDEDDIALIELTEGELFGGGIGAAMPVHTARSNGAARLARRTCSSVPSRMISESAASTASRIRRGRR